MNIKISTFILLLINPLVTNAVIVGDKDWFQVTELGGVSSDQLRLQFSSVDGKCLSTSCMVNGYELGSHTWASTLEVLNMLELYGFDIERHNGYAYAETVSPVMDSFYAEFDPFNAAIWGLTRSSALGYPFTDRIRLKNQTALKSIYVQTDHWHSIVDDPTGAWMYTSAVPIPSAVWLFGSALIGLVGLKCKS